MTKSAAAGAETGCLPENTVLTAGEAEKGKGPFCAFLAGSLVFHLALYFFLLFLEPAVHSGGGRLIEVAFAYKRAPSVPASSKQIVSAAPEGLTGRLQQTAKQETGSVPASEIKPEGSPGTAEKASGPDTYLDDAFALWIAGIQNRISSLLSYPRLARENGIEGTAVVRFAVDQGGRVIDAKIINSSGSNLLDAEAVRVVRRASPFPPPAGTERKYFSMPVTFTLK